MTDKNNKTTEELLRDVRLVTTIPKTYGKPHSECLHDHCERCGGTGINVKTKTVCIHMISCNCPRCRNYSL
jgi:Ribonuclease G/E